MAALDRLQKGEIGRARGKAEQGEGAVISNWTAVEVGKVISRCGCGS